VEPLIWGLKGKTRKVSGVPGIWKQKEPIPNASASLVYNQQGGTRKDVELEDSSVDVRRKVKGGGKEFYSKGDIYQSGLGSLVVWGSRRLAVQSRYD